MMADKLRNSLPLLISLLLHALLIGLGCTLITSLPRTRTVAQDQLVVPNAELDATEAGAIPVPGVASDTRLVPDATLDIPEQAIRAHRADIAVGMIGGTGADGGVIALGPGVGRIHMGESGIGGPSGAVAPFGVPGGAAGLAPRSPFMGVSGNAYRVIYVCDASGQMVNARRELIRALQDSVLQLKPNQFFNIVFFNEGGLKLYNAAGLVPATARNKAAVAGQGGWIESSYNVDLAADPIPALQRAFQHSPELVYLLTCGLSNRKDAQLPQRVLEEIRKLNPDRKVRINTILVRSRGQDQEPPHGQPAVVRPELENDVRVLSQIANENGGHFRQATVE